MAWFLCLDRNQIGFVSRHQNRLGFRVEIEIDLSSEVDGS